MLSDMEACLYINNKTVLHKEEFLTTDLVERVYKDCKFSNFGFEGGDIGAVFIDCAFENIKTYFTLFSVCTFLNVKFENCVFEGTSFMSCTFVKCSFVNCALKDDQVGGHTKFERSELLLSKFENCKIDAVEYIDSKVINE